MFLLKNNGALYSISRRTGEVRWRVKLGYLAAASPACEDGTVYSVILARGKGVKAGRIVARRRGHRPHALVAQAAQPHGVLAAARAGPALLRQRGRDRLRAARRRRRRSSGPTRPAARSRARWRSTDGRLYFGDYNGQVTSLRRADGKQLWKTGTSGGAFGLKSGNFYATPSVAYGRVYIGNTDGFVYSFGAGSGKLAWRHKTGGYVYSSPAISPVNGGTVYAGSYDGKLYAFDARTGSVRWTHKSGGKISGGPTVIGDLVFYSNLSRHSTGAVGAANGKKVWSIGRGAFNPVISDGKRIYLVGYATLYAFGEEGRTADGTLTGEGRAKRRDHLAAVAKRRHARYVARRVAQRKREVARRLELRRRHIEVCFKSDGKTKCRIPKPPVCFERADGRTVCRARKEASRRYGRTLTPAASSRALASATVYSPK